jgi:hypothetical protein
VVRIAGLFGDRQPARRAQHATELAEGRPAVGDLTEHGDEEGDVERRVGEGQPRRIRHGAADVADARAIEPRVGPREHLRLHIDELQAAAGQVAGEGDAEVSGTRPHLEHPGGVAEMEALGQALGRENEPPQRGNQQPGELMGVDPRAG